MDILFQRMVAVAFLIISFAFLNRSLGFDRVIRRRRPHRDFSEDYEADFNYFRLRLDELEKRVTLIESSFIAGTIVPTQEKK